VSTGIHLIRTHLLPILPLEPRRRHIGKARLPVKILRPGIHRQDQYKIRLLALHKQDRRNLLIRLLPGQRQFNKIVRLLLLALLGKRMLLPAQLARQLPSQNYLIQRNLASAHPGILAIIKINSRC
jgi:hypothetical protein